MSFTNVTLYSTGCPRCNVLIKKLNNSNVDYTIVSSVDEMKSLGITEVPVLKVDDDYMNFSQANQWINHLKEELD